jgi:hypothetical protein
MTRFLKNNPQYRFFAEMAGIALSLPALLACGYLLSALLRAL